MDKVKIFDYVWHIAHQWDMISALREDCEFYYCPCVKKSWDTSVRPLPSEICFVPYYEPDKYDVAILHIDQSVVDPICQKRLIFDHFNSSITDIPKIIINHGTPVFPEYFNRQKGLDMTNKEIQEESIRIIRELVGNNTMVVNSYTAATEREWGFGHPIVHGMNPADWEDLTKEPRVFTAISNYGFDHYYNRKCLEEMAEILGENYGYYLEYARVNIIFDNQDEYKKHLGKSLLYFDSSIRTPMNRARTEAFLSGCCVIQVDGAHDLEYWAEDRQNIVLVPDDPVEIARVVSYYLGEGYNKALQIGQNGKKMAVEMFSPERYRNDWLQLFEQVGVKRQ